MRCKIICELGHRFKTRWAITNYSQNEHNGVSNHWCLECFLIRLFMRRSKKTSKLRITGLYDGNPPVAGAFPLAKGQKRVSLYFITLELFREIGSKIAIHSIEASANGLAHWARKHAVLYQMSSFENSLRPDNILITLKMKVWTSVIFS